MRKGSFLSRAGIYTASTLMMLSLGMTSLAAGSNYDTENIGGTKTTTFEKFLVMDQNASVPTASFTYAVTAGAPMSYDVDGKKFEVLAGVDANKVTMAGVGTETANTIAYTASDTTTTDANAYVKNYDPATQKYAKKSAALDFSGVKFPEPGVYRYIITESGVNPGISNDADLTRVVDVYVQDASDDTGKKLSIAGYVLHANEDDEPEISAGDEFGSAGSYGDTKSQGFTNVFVSSDLTFRKEVSGNQASKDKYFAFTVKLTGAPAGTVYAVDLSDADATSGTSAATIAANAGKTNPTTLTVGEDGTATAVFYLQHGQEITIKGIGKDVKYDVTENAEDYKSMAAGVTDYDDPVSGTIDATDLNTSYLNTRNGVIPTGVIMTVAPFAVVTLLGGAGAVTILMKKKKQDEDA